ncbi:HNH endonuclease signature motif containing protein [Terrabacter terrigena]|uniref:HNH endonuclease signature motif containing protein n=1 Tax=Terrabacter terrigena TaxID=574718 RepID=A0ABW3N0W9_9MICO
MPYHDTDPATLARIAFVLGARGERASARRFGGSAERVDAAGERRRVDSGDSLRDEGLDAEAEEIVAEIEALERSKARIEAQLLDAYAALHTVEELQLARLPRTPVPLSAEQVVTQEIACATGVGAAEVSRRLELATAPRRHRVVRERLRDGRVSLHRALQVVAETRSLDDSVLPGLETAVLAPAPDGSVSSQRLFISRLRRCVRSADHRGEDERHCAAVRRRRVHGHLTDDGMGVFTVVAPGESVVGVLDRVDALARAARAAGDERTLDQLRSDLLCDLALFGIVPATGAQAAPAVVAPTCGSWLASAPPAVVRIVVPFEVAVGLSDAACEIPGHGWVTAAHARQIMTAPGSVWQRLAVDVNSGRALELSTDRYAPTREMVEHVRAVDGVCRAPGCQVPAERCDLDHIVPWPEGETRVSNLESLSRGCHNPKTARVWTVERIDDDGVRWTSLAGRSYVTYPRDWREALRDPGAGPPSGAESELELPESDPPPF